MKEMTFVLGLACALGLPAAAAAQPGTPGQPRTQVNGRTQPVAPRFGFAVGADVGPNNTPGYPYVHTVVPGSNAERAGLQVGDTLLTINGRDARDGQLFPVRDAGTRYLLRVRRGREELELTFIFPVIPPRTAPGAPAPAATRSPRR